MSLQIEILEIILLFISIVLFTFGIVGLKFNLTDKLYFKYIFAGVLVLSFLSMQAAIFTYIIKFDLYFGRNAALLIFVLSLIVSSPFILRLINSARVISFSPGKTFRHIEPAVEMKVKEPKPVEESKLVETPKLVEELKLVVEPKLEEEPKSDTESLQETVSENIAPIEIEPESLKLEEVTASEKIQIEKSAKDTAPKKAPAKKKAPVKKSPAKKPAAKTKPRGKK